MRLEQENDLIAHDLVTSKVTLRKDLDAVSITQLHLCISLFSYDSLLLSILFNLVFIMQVFIIS